VTKERATNWPKHISNYDPHFSEIKTQMKSQNLGFKVKFNLCEKTEEMTSSTHDIDLFCFQHNEPMLHIGLNKNAIPDLFNFLKYGEKPESLNIQKLPEDYYILVCSHRAKDDRCGHCGPKIADEFEEKLLKQSVRVAVLKVSHTGKHQYAANVISYPSGDWYGYVKPKDVPRIIEQLHSTSKPYHELGDIWRGAMYLTPEEQIARSPNALLKLQTSSRTKVLKRTTHDWQSYGFGPVGEVILNDVLMIFFLILAFLTLYHSTF